jgi:hypothetical protein
MGIPFMIVVMFLVVIAASVLVVGSERHWSNG